MAAAYPNPLDDLVIEADHIPLEIKLPESILFT